MNYKITINKAILIIALFVYTLTAFFSTGYFNADEHYQIIEFAGVIDGTNNTSDLPWEYTKKIRSIIQPAIAFSIFKISSFFSITDPYSKAFILRLITALLSVFIINNFINEAKRFISSKHWVIFYLLSYFLWFLPFINVRFSSETWSGLFFLYGVTIILKKQINYYQYILLGTVLGFSFLFRYQISFAILGLLLWLFLIYKENLLKISICCAAILCTIFLGVLLDSWFYNEWTLAPYNYFLVNIIDDKASEFGTYPWYFYSILISLYSLLPIGIIIIFSSITFSLTKSKNLITWIIIPFLIIHSLVPHKEIRFLFPIINFIPLIIISSYEYVLEKKWYVKNKKWLRISLILIICLNFYALFFANTKASGDGRSAIIEKIHQLNDKQNLNILVTEDFYPKYLWPLNSNFYQEKNANFINIEKDKFNYLFNNNTRNVMIVSINDLNKESIKQMQSKLKMIEIEQTFPKFSFPLFKKANLGNKVFLLYNIENPKF